MRKLLILFLLLPFFTNADEGQYPPDDLKAAPLSKQGIQLKAKELWDGQEGLMSAAIDVGGCSGGFVSQDGLIITNHHCAFSAIQQASTVEKNYVKDGFLASTRSEEIPARAGTRALILKRIVDVTDRVMGPDTRAAKARNDVERYEAVERSRKEIVAQCEKNKGRRCQVASFYDGLQFKLHEQLELKDVRVVYSPPRSIGEYGGEIDNWQWPRHTGDFAILRAYVNPAGEPADYSPENIPYRTKFWFPLSSTGVQKGDSILIMGYPGKTHRFLTSSAVKDQLEWFHPLRTSTYRDWIAILEAAGQNDPEIALRTSSRIKSLSNREKNSRGQIAGLNRNRVLEKTIEQERQLQKWIESDPNRKSTYGDTLAELENVLQKGRMMRDHDFLLNELPVASNYLASAMTAVRFAKERKKPDLEREAGYQERDLDQAIKREQDRSNTLAPSAERKALAYLLKKIFELPQDQQLNSLAQFPEAKKDPEAWLAKFDSETALKDEKIRVENLSATVETLQASKDPYMQLALVLDADVEKKILRDKEFQGALLLVRPGYLKALTEFRGGNIYPDANGTLRLSVAEIQGYSPEEAVRMEPQTTIKGMAAKHTGEEPFDLPERMLQAAIAEEKEVPLCFLANGDTTGGSSGSPILSGNGKLVGVNFDRVWENVAGDFGWTPTYSRNIGVDARFVLWMLREVEGAKELVAELTADR
jgi:hypothetical protein